MCPPRDEILMEICQNKAASELFAYWETFAPNDLSLSIMSTDFSEMLNYL